MLDIQRYRDYERYRLMTEDGMTEEEADAVLDADKKPFRPAFPKTSAVMMDQHAPSGAKTTWSERVASYQRRLQEQAAGQ